ncbi:family 78 glycoside hydrolase catalytic domain [Cohnella sp. GCM10012308]|uniref:alpha-L-rhamnosidase n=1 Tax=Cohnella sp. GCM10012308 TaxID=3317329 RepID=UPI00360D6ECD
MTTLQAVRLRTEYLEDPLGIDTLAPRLGWTLSDAGGRRGAAQTAYRILAASSPERLAADEGDLWDSGIAVSASSAHVSYEGAALHAGQPVWWKVQVRDERGDWGAWSDGARWSVGLLSRGEWEGIWIGRKIGRKPTREQPLPAVYLRRRFASRAGVRRATVYATALGLYRLHLNGRRIGQDALAPEWTDYHVRVQYQTYDVTELLQEGDNALAVTLGHGWYTGYIGMYGYQKYGMDPSFLLQLNIKYEDGTTQSVCTDETWRASYGPIVAADIQMGETHDARLAEPQWEQPTFEDAAWALATRMYDYRGLVVAQMSPPIRVTQELAPAEVRLLSEGRALVDMGQMTSGYLRVVFEAAEGVQYTLRYAEALDEQGELYTANLRYARQTDAYICVGDGRETFEPLFTYHGYRYVEISGGPTPRPEDIVGVVVHSALPEAGTLETSDPLVNRLLSNIRWTQRANYMSVPTDCPQRDERHGWTGDAQIFARTAAYNMDVSAFLAKWLTDLDDGQRPTGAYTDFAPFIFGPKTEFDNDFTYTHTASSGWADAPPIIAKLLHELYGDREVLRRHYPALRRWMAFNETLYPDGIRRDAPQYGDWLSLPERPYEEAKAELGWLIDTLSTTPYDVFGTAYYADGAAIMADIARELGEIADAERYSALHEKIKQAFQREFVDGDGRIKGDTQTVYAMALAWDLLSPVQRETAMARLTGKIESAGVMAATGFHGTRLVMDVLSDGGREDLAFGLLTRKAYPSWLYSVLQGATTIWERWDGWTEERGFQRPGMNSLCHYAFGAVGEWIYKHVGGIAPDPAAPGFGRAIVRPRPLGGFTWARCGYDSIRGRYEVDWRLAGSGALELAVTVPAGGEAIVHVPADAGTPVLESGKSAVESEGIEALGRAGDCETYRAASGRYLFTSQWHPQGGSQP